MEVAAIKPYKEKHTNRNIYIAKGQARTDKGRSINEQKKVSKDPQTDRQTKKQVR